MLHTRLYHSAIFRESHHGLSGIPGAAGAIGVAVKPSVEKHISGLNFHAAPKTGLYKRPGQDDARVTLQMTVAGGRTASRKCLDPKWK
jgi:hypothetical protein